MTPINVLDRYYLLITFLVTVGFQFLCFLVALIFKTDKITDLSGCTNHLFLPLLTLLLSRTNHPRNIVASALYMLWAARLGAFLFRRILSSGRDTRFDAMRTRPLALLGFWAFQAAWVFIGALPTTLLNAPATLAAAPPPFGTAGDIAGIVLFALGLALETAADVTRRRGGSTDGVWGWSRHPNYFGEIVLQAGVFALAGGAARGAPWLWAAAASPALTAALLLAISGLPVSEKSTGARRWREGRWDEWRAYVAGTSVLVPMPRAAWAALPRWVKASVGCEWAWLQFVPGEPEEQGIVNDGGAAGDGGVAS